VADNTEKVNLGMLSFKEWKQTGKCLESELTPEELAALRKSKNETHPATDPNAL